VVDVYHPDLAAAGIPQHQLLAFYGALVERVARRAAEWVAAGFICGVLNTDNMSLAGESFDYGPLAFLETWDPGFTADYFDQGGLYAYGRQPLNCHRNLRLLQKPLAMLLPCEALEPHLERFAPAYAAHYRALMLRLLAEWPVAYGTFFQSLADCVARAGVPPDPEALTPFMAGATDPPTESWLGGC
jgi:uncharacterized protein YdiU (UPF0061 family)